MNLKQNKGIGLTDALIAVGILIIFTGIIISVSYNIYIQSNFIKRNEQATNYIVELFEFAQGMVYEDVDSDALVNYINKKNEKAKAISGEYVEGTKNQEAYTIFINVKDKEPNYIKQIDVTIIYKLGKKNKIVNMSTFINK